ncbi:hypothetical protein [Mycoplasma sp. SG1]|uniref:hypothetical protein n=1 Tax=Mycoplasma sp. SG1 TaxID=2810348 RepID=UPI002024F502|nr:hypothetical protein [Mycoplasma sp. SG1]URM52768.1 hypothetical protein JRW51_00260 [Mycoplasma sp. SG1]
MSKLTYFILFLFFLFILFAFGFCIFIQDYIYHPAEKDNTEHREDQFEYVDNESKIDFIQIDWCKFHFTKAIFKENPDLNYQIKVYYYNDIPKQQNELLKYELLYSINGKLFLPVKKEKQTPIASEDYFTLIVPKTEFQNINYITFYLDPFFPDILDASKFWHYNLTKWHLVLEKSNNYGDVFINNSTGGNLQLNSTLQINYNESKEQESKDINLEFITKLANDHTVTLNNNFLTIKSKKYVGIEIKSVSITEGSIHHYFSDPKNLPVIKITQDSKDGCYKHLFSINDYFYYDPSQNQFYKTAPSNDKAYHGLPLNIYNDDAPAQLIINLEVNKIINFKVIYDLNTLKMYDSKNDQNSLTTINHSTW